MVLRASAALLLLALLGCDAEKPADLTGNNCTTHAQCGTLACVADLRPPPPTDLAPLPLSCAKPADKKGPGEACDDGSLCALGLCLLAGACAEPCDTGTDCQDRERCQAVYARTGSAALQTVKACVAMVDLPSDVQVSVEVRSHALHGALDDVALPSFVEPSLYVLEHLDDQSWPLPSSSSACRPPLCTSKLVAADAAHSVLFDESAIGMQPDGPINPVANGDHVNPVTVLIPNSPRTPASPAGYTLSLESKLPGDLRVTTLRRSTRGHKLDLNLYYVGARDFSVIGDRGPALLADALSVVDTILGQADIFIGDVRQIDVRGKLLTEGVPLPEDAPSSATDKSRGFVPIQVQYGVYPQLPELWKLSAGAGNVALDLFFVSDIELIAGGDVGAISGGTPGPLGMHGTAGSGIAVATDMMLAQNDPKSLGRTLAHEIGHMLGLFHTVEIDGTVRDPFSDTPVCTLDHDTNGNGSLEASECQGAGGDNLMFPTVDAQSTTLTPQQLEVLRAALILQ